MNQLPDYSENWLGELTDAEIEYWSRKFQSEKDWWAFNTQEKDRVSLLRTEIAAIETHKKLLHLSEAEHQVVLDRLRRNADAARARLSKHHLDGKDK